MLSFHIDGHRFHLRAAAVVIEEGHLLLHRLEADPIWALPGGRVEAGEAAADTIVREMMEEAAEPLTCGEMLFVIENFFEHAGTPQHELGLYFRAALASDSRLRDKAVSHQGIEGDQALEFRWFALSTLDEVNLYPISLRRALADPMSGLRHIVDRE